MQADSFLSEPRGKPFILLNIHLNDHRVVVFIMGSPGGSVVKNPPAVQEMQKIRVRSLSQEDPLEESMTTHSSILAWRIPMDRGAWQATVHGVTKSWTRLRD